MLDISYYWTSLLLVTRPPGSVKVQTWTGLPSLYFYYSHRNAESSWLRYSHTVPYRKVRYSVRQGTVPYGTYGTLYITYPKPVRVPL